VALVRRLIVFGAALAVSAGALAQQPSFSRNGSVSLSAMVEKQVAARKNGLDVPPAGTGVQLYKVRYQSCDMGGAATRLTGLVIMPQSAPKGLLLYYHSTIGQGETAPSRYNGSNKDLESEYVMLAFASGGYAVAIPDYMGLGDSDCVHPYPGSEANCDSGIDLIAAARILAKRTATPLGNQLYVAGYSQGGAVAMCTVRRLEKNGAYKPTAAAPMSGPYDLSGETARSLLKGKQSPESLATKLFLMGYAAHSISSQNPSLDLKDYFAPSFATYVPYVFNQKLGTVATAKKLFIKAVQLGAYQSIIRVLSPKFFEALKWSDPANPMIVELMKNDCYDWAPRTKMLLPYLKQDDVVVAANTIKTLDTMRLNGVGPERLRSFEIDDPKLSHSSAAPVAFSATRRFFDGGFSSLTASP
jgi:pimeloyl-ACP methyl ester carboxylesterase